MCCSYEIALINIVLLMKIVILLIDTEMAHSLSVVPHSSVAKRGSFWCLGHHNPTFMALFFFFFFW